MAKKSKLLTALDAHKGRDYEAEKRKKQIKVVEKRKRDKFKDINAVREELENLGAPKNSAKEKAKPVSILKATGKENNGPAEEEDDFEDFSGSEEGEEEAELKENGVSTIPQPANGDVSASEADPESDVPLSDLSEEDREDTIPYQRMTINNGPALLTSQNRVRVVRPKMRFSAHNSLVSTLPPASTVIPDPNDDLTRELEFYRICRTAATDARTLLKKEGVPFTRPSDYFAEMVKSDEHMGKVKKKMHDEAAGKKAAGEARALRDAKKFGKAVQVAKEQERAKDKRQTLDKISSLKRKRKGQDTGQVNEADDLFQSIDVEDGAKTDRQGRERDPGRGVKRQKRDQKFGFGGKKRFAKSGDAASTANMREFSVTRMKPGQKGGAAKRPGKNRRAAAR